MNTDITGIGNLEAVKTATQNFKNSIYGTGAYRDLYNIYTGNFNSSMKGQGISAAEKQYCRAAIDKIAIIAKTLDKLIESIDGVKANYSKVENAAVSTLSTGSKRLRS